MEQKGIERDQEGKGGLGEDNSQKVAFMFPEREILSDLPKKRLYTPEDLPHFDYLRDMGFPGEEPYLRGMYPTMYRSRLWGMAEYSGFGMPEDTNKRWKYLLQQGQTGVSVAYDLPTMWVMTRTIRWSRRKSALSAFPALP